MLDASNIASYRGANLVDSSGDKVGTIQEIYLDDYTGQPEWVLVNTGLFGTKSTFVPLQGAAPEDQNIRAQFTKDQIKNAPNLDADQHLSETEEQELWRYYGLDYDAVGTDTTTTAGVTGAVDTTTTTTTGYDTSGPTTDDAMTLSEERVNIGTRQREAGRARLRKYIVTENVTQTVPVSREEVRLEREPITEANRDAAYAGPELSEEEHEVVLREEVPVVDKDVVATERVSLGTETVTEQRSVTEQARREEVQLEQDGTTTVDRDRDGNPLT
jgi:uncharacterized protein (TIGR02271 family)